MAAASIISTACEDPTLCELFGLKKIVGDDTVRRLFRKIGSQRLDHQRVFCFGGPLPNASYGLDSTVQTRYGRKEGAQVGYNPQKPGRKVITLARSDRWHTALPYYRWRPGNTGSSTN